MALKDIAVDDAMVSEQIQQIAEEHIRAGRHAEAIRLYQKLRERHPDEDSLLLALAWAYHDDGQTEKAVACFEILFRKELGRKVFTGFAFDELVRIFKRQARYDRLLDICEQAVAAQPGDYALLGDLGDAYLKTGRADRAAAIYGQMIEMEPDDAVVFTHLGNALIQLVDFTGAGEAYAKAIALDPERGPSYYCRLAEAYLKADRRERAEQAIRKSVDMDTGEPAYRLMLGDILIASGNVIDGCRAYESAAELRPASSGAYYFRLGNTLAKALCHEQAAAAFKKAVTAEPGNAIYYLKLAETYLALGHEESALEAIKQANPPA